MQSPWNRSNLNGNFPPAGKKKEGIIGLLMGDRRGRGSRSYLTTFARKSTRETQVLVRGIEQISKGREEKRETSISP